MLCVLIFKYISLCIYNVVNGLLKNCNWLFSIESCLPKREMEQRDNRNTIRISLRYLIISVHTLDMKEAIVSGLYLAFISRFGGVELRYFLSAKLGLK